MSCIAISRSLDHLDRNLKRCIGSRFMVNRWFQFEAAGWAPWSQPLESLMHAFNFLQYRVSGYQVRTHCVTSKSS